MNLRPWAISLIMPTIEWGPTFQRCVHAAAKGLENADQLLVVFDGTAPQSLLGLLPPGARLLQTEIRQGPAAARNLAAKQAHGSILFFVDADVELHPDAVDRVRSRFYANPRLSAVFGSYDSYPPASGLVSRFRNLLHHYTHASHPGPATTFWAGCGAVRLDRFLSLGGFNPQAYPLPSIEDIEFGLRLHGAGDQILLDPMIQGTHHKHWSLGLMLRTDIQQRAIPWSQLLVSGGKASTSLNLDPLAKMSSLLALLTVFSGIATVIQSSFWPIPLVSLGWIVLLNRGFYVLCMRRGGTLLCVAAIGLHGLYFLYSLLTFSLILMQQSLCSSSYSKRG